MAFYVYSVEAFPGSKESGRNTEYIQVRGCSFNIPARMWMKLEKSYSEPRRHNDWKDETGSAPSHFAEELVPLIEEKYGFRGIVFLDGNQPGSTEAKAAETRALLLNKAWRETVVQDFLTSRRIAESGQPGGRFLPNPYETECFAELGIALPNTAEDLLRSQQPAQIVVQLTPEAINAAAAQSGSAKPATAKQSKSVAVAELDHELPTRTPGEPLR